MDIRFFQGLKCRIGWSCTHIWRKAPLGTNYYKISHVSSALSSTEGGSDAEGLYWAKPGGTRDSRPPPYISITNNFKNARLTISQHAWDQNRQRSSQRAECESRIHPLWASCSCTPPPVWERCRHSCILGKQKESSDACFIKRLHILMLFLSIHAGVQKDTDRLWAGQNTEWDSLTSQKKVIRLFPKYKSAYLHVIKNFRWDKNWALNPFILQ